MKTNFGEPVYVMIANDLKKKMIAGDLKPGDLLPSENELTTKFSASRETVRKSLKQVENEGYIYSRPGKGYFVTTPKYGVFSFEFIEDTEDVTIKYLNIVDPPEHVALALNIRDKQKVIEVRRLIQHDHAAVAYDIKYFPYTRGKPTIEGEIEYAIFTEVAAAKTSAFAFHTKLELSVGKARTHLAEKMGIAVGEPLLIAKRYLIGPDDIRLGYEEKFMTEEYGAINATSEIFQK